MPDTRGLGLKNPTHNILSLNVLQCAFSLQYNSNENILDYVHILDDLFV